MKKHIVVALMGVVLITVVFCGCQAGQVNNDYSKIFHSNVVKLLNYTLDFEKDRYGAIVKASVGGRIQNIVDKTLSITITVDFYDKSNQILGNSSIEIVGLLPKGSAGSSTGFPPPFLTYEGENVASVDHVIFWVNEI